MQVTFVKSRGLLTVEVVTGQSDSRRKLSEECGDGTRPANNREPDTNVENARYGGLEMDWMRCVIGAKGWKEHFVDPEYCLSDMIESQWLLGCRVMIENVEQLAKVEPDHRILQRRDSMSVGVLLCQLSPLRLALPHRTSRDDD
jgi:hypothetical protein